MNLTWEQCQEFWLTPDVNPLTGRKIEIGKATHAKLVKACKRSPPPRVPLPMKPRAPPMGPMIHWRIERRKEQENMAKFMNHIKNRLVDINKSDEPLSMMEMDEFKDICKFAKDIFEGNTKALEFIGNLEFNINNFMKERKHWDDRPPYRIVGDFEVFPHRYKNRENILQLLSIYTKTKKRIDYVIEHNEASVDISKGLIDDLKEGKQYMDYLIDHHIFTYDDLYKNTFESDKVFDELAVRYEKFREIYDKLKGKKSKSK